MTRKAKPTKPVEIITDSAIYAPKCPKCGIDIAVQATVPAFLTPPEWSFWGHKDEGRWARCKGEVGGYQYVHFRTMLNGQFSERLAWIEKQTAPVATQEALL